MLSTDLTIFNPQQIKVNAEVFLPGKGTEGRLLEPQETWAIPNGVTSGQWVAFFDPENGELLAAALLPNSSTEAQLLLSLGISGILRMNPVTPLTASNGITEQVIARVQDVGAAASQDAKLAPRGQKGSAANFSNAKNGQWLGFYDSEENYITGTAANGLSEVVLEASRQSFVVGAPFPLSQEAVAEGRVRLTQPAVS